MDRGKRLQKSETAREKRKKVKETLETIEKRKYADAKNLKKKYKKIDIGNLKTNISNKKINHSVNGNTNTVYINPLNSLKFVLNKLKKDKIDLDKDFWVFTGSTVGVVPIKSKGLYLGKIAKLGSSKVKII